MNVLKAKDGASVVPGYVGCELFTCGLRFGNISIYHQCGNIGVCNNQTWGSYFLKVTRYLLLLPTTKNISLQLHIT